MNEVIVWLLLTWAVSCLADCLYVTNLTYLQPRRDLTGSIR